MRPRPIAAARLVVLLALETAAVGLLRGHAPAAPAVDWGHIGRWLTTAAPDDASAMAQINGFLGAYGLADLGAWAWAKWQNNESVDQIMLELRSTPQYKTRFPAMDELSRQGRAINETDYIGYESTVRQLIRAAGLPAGMYDTPVLRSSSIWIRRTVSLVPSGRRRVMLVTDSAEIMPVMVRPLSVTRT